MFATILRYATAKGARHRAIEKLIRKWLSKQLITPVRPRELTLKNRFGTYACHIDPHEIQDGKFVSLDVRERAGGKVIMAIRIRPNPASYVTTIWC